MRLPVSKLYRAFPELDPFTDDQCIAYILNAKRRHRLWTMAGGLVVLVVVVFSWMIAGAVFGLGVAILPRPVQSRVGWDFFFAFGFGTVVFLGALLGLWVRDWWLRRLIRLELNEAKCVKCNYSLLGLRIESGAVRCPECGNVCVLDDLGLTPADLIAETGEC